MSTGTLPAAATRCLHARAPPAAAPHLHCYGLQLPRAWVGFAKEDGRLRHARRRLARQQGLSLGVPVAQHGRAVALYCGVGGNGGKCRHAARFGCQGLGHAPPAPLAPWLLLLPCTAGPGRGHAQGPITHPMAAAPSQTRRCRPWRCRLRCCQSAPPCAAPPTAAMRVPAQSQARQRAGGGGSLLSGVLAMLTSRSSRHTVMPSCAAAATPALSSPPTANS